MTLRAPFPWFGGKRRIAPVIWERFGEVANYIEPFAGSLAVLLARPHAPRVETVNDKDAYVANFWRAVSHDPDAVAAYADWPVNEADLHARHQWLVSSGRERVDRLTSDPDYFDAKVAGWWVWGLCLWIGTGWCVNPGWRGRGNAAAKGRGINAARSVDWMPRPDLSAPNGRGDALRLERKRPAIASGNGQGSGVHRVGLARQIVDLAGDSGAAGRGIHATGFDARTGGVFDYMRALQERLRRVRVCVGDWERVVSPAVTTCLGITGMLLDPPYHGVGTERSECYAHDAVDVWHAAKDWAIAHGDDPLFRIALCGHDDGTHGIPDTWACVEWKASGGYGRTPRALRNAARERIWFSPHCLVPADRQGSLFEAVGS